MDFSNKQPIIAAHRGDRANFPENTMPAFESAVNMHADMIETDIHLTKDNVLVLIHDHTLERTTDGTGNVCDKTYEELCAFNAGTDEIPAKIPTLEEFLSYVSGFEDMLLDLELKVYLHIEGARRAELTVDKTIEMCKKFGIEKRILFNSFDAYALEYINKKYPGQFLLHGYYPYTIMKNVSENPENYLDYACYWAVGEEAEKSCKYLISKGINPCTGSDTEEDVYREAVGFGCRMFTENDPKKFLLLRQK